MSRLKISWFLAVILMIFATSCQKSTWEAQERKMIDDYVKSLGDTAYVLYPSGLYYIELEQGTGSMPVDYDTVYFRYEAKFLNHVTWDANDPGVDYKHVMGTDNGPVVAGIDEGLRYMHVGGKAKLLTPSSLAYKDYGVWQIVPGYTPLLWIIQLDSLKAGPGK